MVTTWQRATLLLTVLALATRAEGQSASGARRTFELGVMAVGVATHASPALFGKSQSEGYLTQPNLMGAVRRGPLALIGTLNFEGYTLRRGELNAGIYGEGFVDRRHPHTLVHEAMMTVTSPSARPLRVSLAVGKGFTPFGTDDPMMRPMVKYPVNHHHAQIIERVQTVGALQYQRGGRSVTLEHAFFNGDEPVSPFVGPQWNRFGDSRSTRLTIAPMRHLEVQASRAFVRSPGITQGGAFDHAQRSVSLRYDREASTHGSTHEMKHEMTHEMTYEPMHAADRQYLLVEYAQTDEGFGNTSVFRFQSLLAEAMMRRNSWGVAIRAERTERPEHARLLDPFRTANGHIDFQIVGITQFAAATMQLSAPPIRPPRLAMSHLTPFLEVAAARPRAIRTPAVFVPREFYGASTLWSLSAGVRVHVGTMRRRMGRYGVLDPAHLSPTPP